MRIYGGPTVNDTRLLTSGYLALMQWPFVYAGPVLRVEAPAVDTRRNRFDLMSLAYSNTVRMSSTRWWRGLLVDSVL